MCPRETNPLCSQSSSLLGFLALVHLGLDDVGVLVLRAGDETEGISVGAVVGSGEELLREIVDVSLREGDGAGLEDDGVVLDRDGDVLGNASASVVDLEVLVDELDELLWINLQVLLGLGEIDDVLALRVHDRQKKGCGSKYNDKFALLRVHSTK